MAKRSRVLGEAKVQVWMQEYMDFFGEAPAVGHVFTEELVATCDMEAEDGVKLSFTIKETTEDEKFVTCTVSARPTKSSKRRASSRPENKNNMAARRALVNSVLA